MAHHLQLFLKNILTSLYLFSNLPLFTFNITYLFDWNDRFRLIGQLHKMGANIDFVSNRARIIGVTKLHGANVVAWDLRSGAGLVVAAAMADGKTRIEQENLIERGYENLVSRVSEIGIRAKKCL